MCDIATRHTNVHTRVWHQMPAVKSRNRICTTKTFPESCVKTGKPKSNNCNYELTKKKSVHTYHLRCENPSNHTIPYEANLLLNFLIRKTEDDLRVSRMNVFPLFLICLTTFNLFNGNSPNLFGAMVCWWRWAWWLVNWFADWSLVIGHNHIQFVKTMPISDNKIQDFVKNNMPFINAIKRSYSRNHFEDIAKLRNKPVKLSPCSLI